MTVVETLLVFVGAPLAVVLTAYALVLLPGLRHRPRYRPGQPWGHEAVWYEPHHAGGGHHAAIPAAQAPRRTAGGGARGTW